MASDEPGREVQVLLRLLFGLSSHFGPLDPMIPGCLG